jgi:hypothetical protein
MIDQARRRVLGLGSCRDGRILRVKTQTPLSRSHIRFPSKCDILYPAVQDRMQFKQLKLREVLALISGTADARHSVLRGGAEYDRIMVTVTARPTRSCTKACQRSLTFLLVGRVSSAKIPGATR